MLRSSKRSRIVSKEIKVLVLMFGVLNYFLEIYDNLDL